MPPKEKPLADRFWPKVRKSDGCWEWTAAITNKGYGMLGGPGGAAGRKLTAHRISWELHCGPVPQGLCVLHRCDNRRCVRPEHLFLGTFQDNTADMFAKGRNGPGGPLGERASSAKLTADAVVAIRAAAAAGVSQRELGRTHGVARQSIRAIVRRESWAHIA